MSNHPNASKRLLSQSDYDHSGFTANLVRFFPQYLGDARNYLAASKEDRPALMGALRARRRSERCAETKAGKQGSPRAMKGDDVEKEMAPKSDKVKGKAPM
jgi:hypothetical protein